MISALCAAGDHNFCRGEFSSGDAVLICRCGHHAGEEPLSDSLPDDADDPFDGEPGAGGTP